MKDYQKKGEKTVKKLFHTAGLESPSDEFKNKVMARVLVQDLYANLEYKPVISKIGWTVVFGLVTILFLLVLFLPLSELSWLPDVTVEPVQVFDKLLIKGNQIFRKIFQINIVTSILTPVISIFALILLELLVRIFRKKKALWLF